MSHTHSNHSSTEKGNNSSCLNHSHDVESFLFFIAIQLAGEPTYTHQFSARTIKRIKRASTDSLTKHRDEVNFHSRNQDVTLTEAKKLQCFITCRVCCMHVCDI